MTTNNSINASSTGLVRYNGTGTFDAVTTTQYDVLVGDASNGISNIGPGSAGQVLRSGGAAANPAYSTATYPATATGTGTILRADGTNWVATTATYPTTTTAYQLLVSTATSVVGGLTAGTTGTVLTGVTGAVPSFSAAPAVTSITFGAGTALSSYVEGTFSPTMVGESAAGTTTYTAFYGYYRRIGSLVTIQAAVEGSAATGTGNALFGALPFTVKNQTRGNAQGSVLSASSATWVFPTGTTSLAFDVILNTTTGYVYGSGTATAGGLMQMANAAFVFQYTVSYEI